MLKIEDTADGIRCIGLNRPDKRNAIGVEMTLALEEVLLKTKVDASVKTIVFHGLGGHFCAGMDMKDFFDSSTRPAELLQRARAATEHWRIQLLREMPQKIFTAVEGYCLGVVCPSWRYLRGWLRNKMPSWGCQKSISALFRGADY